jgi:hypothetical protein
MLPQRYTLLILLAIGPLLLSAQEKTGCQPQIRLVGVEVDRDAPFVGLRLLAQDANCSPVGEIDVKNDLVALEGIANNAPQPLEIVTVERDVQYDSTDLKKEKVDVLFLVDVSEAGSIGASQDMIRTFMGAGYLGNNAEVTYRIRTFDESLREEVDHSAEAVTSLTLKADTQPHLYGALIKVLNDLADRQNKQMLFVFSRGVNVSPDYSDRPRLPPRAEDVYAAARSLGERLYLFTVSSSRSEQGGAAGAEEGFMRKLPGYTPQSDDGHAVGQLPRGVAEIFSNDRRLLSTHVALVRTQDRRFTGRLRKYVVKDITAKEEFEIEDRFTTYNDPFLLGEEVGAKAWYIPTLTGILLVGFLLAIFYAVIPRLRQQRFLRKSVAPYVARPGRQILDPLTREPIQPGEPVVNVCSMVVPLNTWRDCGHQCPHYPGCTSNNLQCDGAGQGQSSDFFALTGSNRLLNWIWFGTLGGLVGWLLYAGLVGFGSEYISAVASESLAGMKNGEALVRDAILGACFGMGLTLLLANIEERSQSRRLSWGRILLRTLLGGLVATAAFGLGFFLQQHGNIGSPVLAAAISWVVFGLGLGLVLSINSSIDLKRGVLGGLLAGVAGFLIYWLVGELFDASLFGKMISLLAAGGLLGLVLDTVVKLAESYEMEYVTPANYRRNVPLSKWLKSNWDIMIGSQPGSQVYIKWADEEVLPEHAILKLDGGRVFIIPHGETLINGRIINGQKRTQLESGDTIQLGRRGTTQMRFWER